MARQQHIELAKASFCASRLRLELCLHETAKSFLKADGAFRSFLY